MTGDRSKTYEKVVTPSSGLRLHLNENTAGCSPRVFEALHAITRQRAALYPDYDAARQATATRLAVPVEEVLLTNGLDEGILAAAVAALRPQGLSETADSSSAAATTPEAIVVVPAFDMYGVCTGAAGGRVVNVPLGADLSFPIREVLAAVGPATRVLFLTNPNNPTGLLIPKADILEILRKVPQALVFVDEAYADFAGESLIGDVEAQEFRNLVIGRTFAKAYGLAGLRAGALVAHAETLAPLAQVVPPYSINIYAATALAAGLNDTEHYDWYLAQVRESKALIYDALDKLGLRYWRSAANFVLVNVGSHVAEVVADLAERGVFVRDRSRDHGCAGCMRVTAGVVEHTRVFVRALEEVL
jgi:histidinol-phosphate aminotransferase